MTVRVLLILVVLVLPAALASHDEDPNCASDGNIAIGTVQIGNGSSPTYYVDDGGRYGLHVYEESNGVEGLQRGGASEIIPDDSEICTDHSPAGPDYLIV